MSLTAALFDSREDAQRAVHALRDHGIDKDRISVLAMAADGDTVSDLRTGERVDAPGMDEGISVTTPEDAGRGAMGGAAIGAGLGLAGALASIFVPGFGLVAAGGALATALGGAAAAAAGGAVAGGVTGYLVDLGVHADVAESTSEAIRRGGIFVSVNDYGETDPLEIRDILHKYNGRDTDAITPASYGTISTPSRLNAQNERLSDEKRDELLDTTDDEPIGVPGVTGSGAPGAFTGSATTLGTGVHRDSTLDTTAGSEGSASSRLHNRDLSYDPNYESTRDPEHDDLTRHERDLGTHDDIDALDTDETVSRVYDIDEEPITTATPARGASIPQEGAPDMGRTAMTTTPAGPTYNPDRPDPESTITNDVEDGAPRDSREARRRTADEADDGLV